MLSSPIVLLNDSTFVQMTQLLQLPRKGLWQEVANLAAHTTTGTAILPRPSFHNSEKCGHVGFVLSSCHGGRLGVLPGVAPKHHSSTKWRANARATRCSLFTLSSLLRKITSSGQSGTSDLQKSRHLQKSRVTERHNRGTKRKLKSHPPAPKKARSAFCCAWCDFNFRFVPRLCRPVTRLLCK